MFSVTSISLLLIFILFISVFLIDIIYKKLRLLYIYNFKYIKEISIIEKIYQLQHKATNMINKFLLTLCACGISIILIYIAIIELNENLINFHKYSYIINLLIYLFYFLTIAFLIISSFFIVNINKNYKTENLIHILNEYDVVKHEYKFIENEKEIIKKLTAKEVGNIINSGQYSYQKGILYR